MQGRDRELRRVKGELAEVKELAERRQMEVEEAEATQEYWNLTMNQPEVEELQPCHDDLSQLGLKCLRHAHRCR